MSLPAEVTSLRLRLPLITPSDRDDMLAGRRQPRWHPDYPREDDRDAASLVRPGPDPWGPRHVVRAVDGLVVGSAGFHGPPAPVDGTPETEIGYGLVEEARGHGAATEAVRALVAEADRLGVRVRAAVEPTNAPALRVLAKTGFTQLRGADEDGRLVLVRPVRDPST